MVLSLVGSKEKIIKICIDPDRMVSGRFSKYIITYFKYIIKNILGGNNILRIFRCIRSRSVQFADLPFFFLEYTKKSRNPFRVSQIQAPILLL